MTPPEPRDARHHILVVDDEPKYVGGIRAILTATGYDVVTAHDGRSAIDLAVRENPGLILMDVRMPGLDGYEACRRLREFSTVPVIMLTAKDQDTDVVRGFSLGADDLHQPQDDLIQRWLIVLTQQGQQFMANAVALDFQAGIAGIFAETDLLLGSVLPHERH